MLTAALLNGSIQLCESSKINYLTVCKLHVQSSHNTQIKHTYCSHTLPYTDMQRIYDWALLQKIQMKQFSHLIHSHPLFIPLGETETLGFSSQRDPGTPSILMSKGNAMQYSGVNHQRVKAKVGSVGYREN